MNGKRHFFFNEWKFLGKVAPELFEARRKNIIEDLYQDSMGPNSLARKLQSEIDAAGPDANSEAVILALAKQLNERLNLLCEDLDSIKDKLKSKGNNSD